MAVAEGWEHEASGGINYFLAIVIMAATSVAPSSTVAAPAAAMSTSALATTVVMAAVSIAVLFFRRRAGIHRTEVDDSAVIDFQPGVFEAFDFVHFGAALTGHAFGQNAAKASYVLDNHMLTGQDSLRRKSTDFIMSGCIYVSLSMKGTSLR